MKFIQTITTLNKNITKRNLTCSCLAPTSRLKRGGSNELVEAGLRGRAALRRFTNGRVLVHLGGGVLHHRVVGVVEPGRISQCHPYRRRNIWNYVATITIADLELRCSGRPTVWIIEGLAKIDVRSAAFD